MPIEEEKQPTDKNLNQDILNSIVHNSFNDRAFGCIIGAFIGDACGSYLEFEEKVANEK